MKKYLILLFIFVCCFATNNLFSQSDTVINGKHYKMVDDSKPEKQKAKKHVIPSDSTFALNNKLLKYYNAWLTLGGGYQQNLTYKRKPGFDGGLDFSFHIKQQYFQLGTNISGEKFGFYNNYQFHVGYGKRYEDKNIHLAGFIGLSYSMGYLKVGDSVYTNPFKQPGIYGQLEAVKKVTYDVGLGISVFGDYNSEQAILGARVILYFSGAYQGKKNKFYGTNKEQE